LQKITSRQHPVVQRLRRLASRRDEGVALLDGTHVIEDALEAHVPLELVLADSANRTLAERAARAGARTYEGSAAVIEAASPVRSPTGVIAIAEWSAAPLTAVFERKPSLIVGLVDVQDPGNAGSAIRSADALGATGVVAMLGTAHPAGWKVVRGAMGSSFRVPVARADATEVLEAAARHGVEIAATVAAGGVPIETANLTAPVLVLVGNEGAGLPDDLLSAATRRLTIPMGAGVNSLNVSVTAALVLWEARRQRLARATGSRTPRSS
jgi:TrmH family RNA methyltransferase